MLATRHSSSASALHGGEVVTWGDPDNGGDSSQVQEQRIVQHIQEAEAARVAIPESGAVVTWGQPDGGDRGASSAEECEASSSQ